MTAISCLALDPRRWVVSGGRFQSSKPLWWRVTATSWYTSSDGRVRKSNGPKMKHDVMCARTYLVRTWSSARLGRWLEREVYISGR